MGIVKGELGAWPGLRADEVSRHAVRLVIVDHGEPELTRFATLPARLRAGDLLIVNDAATLPGSLHGRTLRGEPFELRLSGPIEGARWRGVLLGAGDHRTRTEHLPAPPTLGFGERVTFGALDATVATLTGRVVELTVDGDDDLRWQTLYAAGSPVQYAHRADRLPLYAVQTAYAARPWAAEMPSAGRPLTWDVLLALRRAGITLATLTHAAGLSATGDDALDRAMPWPERYEIPAATIAAIEAARDRGGRVIAVGTTVVRALEAAADGGAPRAGAGIATQRLGPASTRCVVDGLISGLHVPGESHFELLAAFAPRARLEQAIALAAARGLSSHELGDALLIVAPIRWSSTS